MRLITFTVQNFRRFVEKTSVKLHGDLIALIGPNEAGKSSILDGLAMLGSRDEFARSDEHRRSGISPTLQWGFHLDSDDKAALAEVPEAASLQRVVLTKHPNGSRSLELHPNYPSRTRGRRKAVMDLIDLFIAGFDAADVPIDAYEGLVPQLRDLSTSLSTDVNDLPDDVVASVNEMGSAVASVEMGFSEDEAVADKGKVGRKRQDLLKVRQNLVTALRDLRVYETGPNPANRAVSIINSRLPDMLLYTQLDRELQGSYDLDEIAENPPPALDHVCNLAGLDLFDLRREVQETRRADSASRLLTANNKLRSAFDKHWNQQKVALQFVLDGITLSIQAISLSNQAAGYSEINERSDGMRWFASLLAFVNGRDGKTILLVDELETHLHYDAQADLINVLANQGLAAKVIYTTHSFGCLPPDIGTGIRVVEPVSDTTSRLVNGFWRTGVRAGFSPLLASLGAAAVSFTPSRHAVIAEGPADAVILPTLLRQATDDSRPLGFQVVPGASEVAVASCAGLQSEAGHVAFLVDGDQGGLDNKTKLIAGGIPPDQIVVLTAVPAVDAPENDLPLEMEDLIDVAVYVVAVNEELRCWNTSPPEITAADIGPSLRTKDVEKWCARNKVLEPDKVAVAERVLDAAFRLEPEDSDENQIYALDRRAVLQKLRIDLSSRLGLT